MKQENTDRLFMIGIDLFSGAGGLSLGFEQAGIEPVAAVEIDPIHAAVHKYNFPRCAVIPRTVEALSGRDIREAAGIGDSEIDVVFGGPPCQGFSLIGQRALDDPRNSLVLHFVRLVSELDASYFVFENVKGLTVGSHKKFLEEVIDAFDAAGYDVQLPWRVLNAANYGVPQDRQRLFLIGARRGLRLPNYPAPRFRAAGTEQPNGLPLGPSCSDALKDLPDAEQFDSLWNSDEVMTAHWGEPSAYAQQLRCEDGVGWFFGHPRIWNPGLLTSSLRTEHTEISRRRFLETPQGENEPISRLFKLPAAGVSNTLRAGTDSSRGAFTSPRPIHYALDRCVTVREMARLHGFPDWFRFHRTKWHGARQVGNAVPPPLARAVAMSIVRALGIVPQRRTNPIELGEPSLLSMDMSQASAYWGIDVPIGVRDRQSGNKKRKQSEIETAGARQ